MLPQLLILIAATATGVGIGPAEATEGTGPPSGPHATSAPPVPQVRFRSLRPPCRAAHVALGRKPRDIRIEALCLRRHGHRFALTVNRRSGSILGYEHRPRAFGPGAVSAHGLCELSRLGLTCEARARGRVTLITHIRVAAASRCRDQLRITQVVPDSCQRKPYAACPENLVIQEFFRGLPRGC